MKNLSLLFRLVAAGILLQTLYFKFTGADESVFIFKSLGVDPWGRWFAGTTELIASLLILVPATQFLGALAALGIMAGAIASHIFILGIVIQNDGGLLFGLACAVVVCCIALVFIHKDQIPFWTNKFKKLIPIKN